MEKKYLIVNPGSRSYKASLFEGERELLHIHLENDTESFLARIKTLTETHTEKISKDDFDNHLKFISEVMKVKGIAGIEDVDAVGLRIVAPGKFFQVHRPIDEEYISKLQEIQNYASQHIGRILEVIAEIKAIFPNISIFGISDSFFHSSMPEVSRIYAIPQTDAEEYGIYRYGYHGISIQSVLSKLEKKLGNIPEKLIVCHLGGGASVTALQNGKTVDTSMGFSPSEGLTMSSRVGDIDSSAVLYLMSKKGINTEDMEMYLNNASGLKGISKTSSDLRDILPLVEAGNADASLAAFHFAYRVKKQIGAYTALLNGVHYIVFCGTIGERSFIMREMICKDLDSFNIVIDIDKNNSIDGLNLFEGDISVRDKISVSVVTTDEVREIAEETRKFL